MKAALYERHGSAREVLRVRDVACPAPQPGEVLVRVHVSGVNPTDHKMRSGSTGRRINGFQIPHHDGAGVIDAVGAGVDPEKVGQRVWVWFAAADRPWGTAAQWTVVPEQQAVPLPAGSSFGLGASLGVPAMTAHRCLFADGPVEDQVVLVAGGAGAVGHFAIQLAKHAGARLVVATVSDDHKAGLASRAGADLVVNYRDREALSRISALAPRVDRVVEVALGANLELDLAVSGPETIISMYATDARYPTLPLHPCMLSNVTIRFVWLYGVATSSLLQAARDITDALDGGAFSALPTHRFALRDIAAAHEAVEAGTVGKIVVDLA